MTHGRLFVYLFFGAALTATVSAADAPATKRPPEAGHPAAADDTVLAGAGARLVTYTERDVITVHTKLRFTTLLVLPKKEQILDFTCGDKEFWVINGNQNFAYVKPAKQGAQTNLNLVTASGNIYSFVLVEVSDGPEAAPDLKVF